MVKVIRKKVLEKARKDALDLEKKLSVEEYEGLKALWEAGMERDVIDVLKKKGIQVPSDFTEDYLEELMRKLIGIVEA